MKKWSFWFTIVVTTVVTLLGGSPSAQATYQANGYLLNISTRGYVGTGDNVLIGGFIISDDYLTVIIRAKGPSLSSYGVSGALSDPMLELYAGSTLIASNDDWESGPWATELTYLEAQPSHPRESAMVVTLPPGAYTVVVRGVGGRTGVALVEVWDITVVAL